MPNVEQRKFEKFVKKSKRRKAYLAEKRRSPYWKGSRNKKRHVLNLSEMLKSGKVKIVGQNGGDKKRGFFSRMFKPKV